MAAMKRMRSVGARVGRDGPLSLGRMRFLVFGLLALAVAAPSRAQRVVTPEPGSTYVVPSHRGEAVRITTYERRPVERGRLARRYLGLRANRTPRAAARPVSLRPTAPLIETPRGTFVRRGTSYFPVVRAR